MQHFYNLQHEVFDLKVTTVLFIEKEKKAKGRSTITNSKHKPVMEVNDLFIICLYSHAVEIKELHDLF